MFGVSLSLKELLWNKEICFYGSKHICFPFFCLSLPHSSFLKIFNHESTLFRLFPHFFLGTFVETMKPKAPVSSGCCSELTLLPRAWGPETPAPRLFHPTFPANRWPYHTRAQHKTFGSLVELSNIYSLLIYSKILNYNPN